MQKSGQEASKLRLATIIIGALGILMVIFMLVVPIVRWVTRKTYIDIATAPTIAKVTIDGKEYKNGSHEIEPGEYTATISADGFESKTITVKVEPRTYTQILDYLVNEKEGLKYFERSTIDLSILRQIKDDKTIADFISQYDEKLKIKDELPLSANYNRNEGIPGAINDIVELQIADGSNDPRCEYVFCLLVESDQSNEKRIRDFLKQNNYNYDNYEVLYK